MEIHSRSGRFVLPMGIAIGLVMTSCGQASAPGASSTAAEANEMSSPAGRAANGPIATPRQVAGSEMTSTPPRTISMGSAGMSAGAAGMPAMSMVGSAARSGTMMPAAGRPADAGTGKLPAVDALDRAGPYMVRDEANTGPGNQFRLFAPEPLGVEGLKHPIVVWSPSAGAFPDAYLTFLETLASHGFVTLSYNSTAEGKNLAEAMDWLLAENERQDSTLFGKLDTTKIAAGGHSAGSLATYQIADDKRLTTTLHLSGGSFMPEMDVPKLRHPALMLCGDTGGDGLVSGDLANPMCLADFEVAQVPVFYAVVKGAGHTALSDEEATPGFGTAPDDPKKLLFIKATVGWLRWQLADDPSREKMFVGDDCELCQADSGYDAKQKNFM